MKSNVPPLQFHCVLVFHISPPQKSAINQIPTKSLLPSGPKRVLGPGATAGFEYRFVNICLQGQL